MYDFADFLHNDAPSQCWGSEEKVRAWIEHIREFRRLEREAHDKEVKGAGEPD
jgi:hypothetical protein